jgi:hypothetical protein
MARKGRQEKRKQQADRGSRRRQKNPMPFDRRNYLLMVAGLLVVCLGYAIMAAESEVDGFWSLYVSPLLLAAGYLEIIYAIIWRPKPAASDPT